MKLSRKQVQRKARTIPQLRFEDKRLTSFAGLILFQALVARLDLRNRLRNCFRHLKIKPAYDYAILMLGLVIHILLGYRNLQDIRFYRDDPMIKRLMGLAKLPDVATLSRMLKNVDSVVVTKLRALLRDLVLTNLAGLQLRRITLDFDGSVQSTGRCAEGTAVGFNKKKKGQRSYYPLFATVAQTGQVLDFLHRPGNVHDSNGALEFIRHCVACIREILPGVLIEVRMDSAFFSDAMVQRADELDVEFTITVPFARFVALKELLQKQEKWLRMNKSQGYFELNWKPKSWSEGFRFLAIRTQTKTRSSKPIQLDLFEPYEEGYEFKVVVTNKTMNARHVVVFHDGRGAQEGVFAELKSEGHMGYIPVRRLNGNQTYMVAVILAHNLNREMQMLSRPRQRGTTEQRSPLWKFSRLETFRRTILQRAGQFTEPQGNLTLTFSVNHAVKTEILDTLDALQKAA